MTEVVIILGLALILLGPDQLPTIAKSIGKGMREIRKATDDLKSTFEQEMVRMDEPVDAPRALQSVTPVAPAADGTTPVDSSASPTPVPPADPASARAAARRSAVVRQPSASMDPLSLTRDQQAQLRLVPPAGAVAQGGAAPAAQGGAAPAASPAPAAPSASPSDDANKGAP
jgi:sec-independent protein translocase protein TatB